MTTPRIRINRNTHAYEQDLTSKRSNLRVFADVAVFLPLSIVISCVIIVMAVFGVPKTLHQLKSAVRSIVPIADEYQASTMQEMIDFTDVRGDSKYYDSIAYLNSRGIVSGYEDGTFKPNKAITRAELIKTVVNAKNQFPLDMNYNSCFTDVGHQWFASAACLAKERGWISGYADGSFGPDDSVTKAEALKIIIEAYDVRLIDAKTNLAQFQDVSRSDWYFEYVQTAQAANLIAENPIHDLYEPLDSITRGEAFQILYRVMHH